MGLITYFKNKFAKDIVVGGDISHHLVFVYKLKKGRIWLASNIEVPDKYVFAICKNGKIYDVFPSGMHLLSGINLPKSVRKFNLTKQLKDGSLPDSFVADAYFVNMNMFEYISWKAYRKPELYDEKYGYFKFFLSGGVAFKVSNANKFLEKLLKVYDYLRQGEAQDIFCGWVSEFIVNELESGNYDYKTVSNIDLLTDNLFEKMNKNFSKMGIEILGLSIEKTKFSSKLKNKIQASVLEKQNIKELDKKLTQQFDEVSALPKKSKKNKKKLKEMPKQIFENDFKTEKTQDEFVDLEEASSYNIEKQTQRCKLCGATNFADAEKCKLCGEVLNRRVILDE